MASELKAAVLLCADGDHAADLARWSLEEDVQVHVVPGLCRRPEEIGRWLMGSDIGRLVLGLCPEEYSLAEVQTAARKAGFDALGVAIVRLRGASVEKDKVLLAAAVARARAYGGSEPENAKLYRSAKLSRRSLFKLAALFEYRAVPSIDHSRCAANFGCDLCMRACPRAALEWSDGTVSYDKAKCDPCGVCVTVCPREAVEYPTCTPAQIEAQIGAFSPPGEELLVGYCSPANVCPSQEPTMDGCRLRFPASGWRPPRGSLPRS